MNGDRIAYDDLGAEERMTEMWARQTDFSAAMSAPVRFMSDRQLFEAVKAIGAYKFDLRNSFGVSAVIKVLRACNARIDELLREEDERRFAARPAPKLTAERTITRTFRVTGLSQ